ncbi:hypothetical protein [Parasulfitobacter algicola]|uniref:Lycopene cyclase domain-containing protein n=1 Tax=Parasulfitobacter algicola TaxID=2614809 RepID=A0ABX2IVH7_9RHOB|nr:hypothetical protein [Sulfitobacter algicola]NSX54193.1 hypothetical protein [Sulfitobacter algicola]
MSVLAIVAIIVSVVLLFVRSRAESGIVRSWLLLLPIFVIFITVAEAVFRASCEGTAFSGWHSCTGIPDVIAGALDAPLFLLPPTTILSGPFFLLALAYIEWKHRRLARQDPDQP